VDGALSRNGSSPVLREPTRVLVRAVVEADEEKRSMPLSDREQKILAEIERHFYEEDPALARAVRNIDRNPRTGMRLPLLGAVSGLVIIGATFTSSTWLALIGFALLVVSATYLAQAIRARGEDSIGDDEEPSSRRKIHRRFKRG
jgi:hypothetical protein